MIFRELFDREQSRIWQCVDKTGSQEVKSNSGQNLSSQLVIIDSGIAGLAPFPNALSTQKWDISCFLGGKCQTWPLGRDNLCCIKPQLHIEMGFA